MAESWRTVRVVVLAAEERDSFIVFIAVAKNFEFQEL